jgi:hypothetical protein
MTFKTIATIIIVFILVVVVAMWFFMPKVESTTETTHSFLKEREAECNKCIEDNSPFLMKCDINSTVEVCKDIMKTTCNEKCQILFIGWG